MSSVCDHFQNKRITLMGLGRLGRGVGDVRFLAACGADVLVTDLKSENELRESVGALRGYDNITFVLGKHREQDFTNTDMVIKAAGVPLDSPYTQAASDAGVPVEMSTTLFAELSLATLVGVTGTRGKTTVTHLVADILEQDGRTVFRGGNIQGISTLEHLPDSTKDEIAVLELDSWQLQGFGEAKLSPHIAVFTSFMPDHMNYYTSTGLSTSKAMERYFEDKAQIFLHQHDTDTLIVSEQVDEYLHQYSYTVPSQKIVVHKEQVPEDWQQFLPGDHNRLNIALAREAAASLGVPEETIKEAVMSFQGVSGRLEYLTEKNGVSVYNDTTATTPDATLAALRALDGLNTGELVLIMGGADKGLDTDELVEDIPAYCKAVVLLPGTGTDRISGIISRISGLQIHDAKNMKVAVEIAFGFAEEGDIILLSPAFASFGLFKNEYDRGEQFVRMIKEQGTGNREQ